MSSYRTGRDYRRYSLELFKEFIPEELHKQIQNFISKHKAKQTTQEDKE